MHLPFRGVAVAPTATGYAARAPRGAVAAQAIRPPVSDAAEVEVEAVGRVVHEHDGDAPVLLVEVAGGVLGHLAALRVAVAGGCLHRHVEDAVADLGVTIREVPVTPARLFALLQADRSGRS